MIWLPKLYKLSSTGKVYEWQIGYDVHLSGGIYVVRHGQVGGKIQQTSTIVSEGKNLDKVNETTPLQQAELEANSLWNKQKDRKGYSLTIPQEKPFRPMLAQKFSEHSKKIQYPAFVQPKLDGCVSYNTILETKEHGPLKIWYIVENKLDCHVLSCDKSGKQEYKKVVHFFENKKVNEDIVWYKITLVNGATLELTGNHPVYSVIEDKYIRADELTINDYTDCAYLTNGVRISKIEKLDIQQYRYNIEVEDNHNYYANGILVHNCRCITYYDVIEEKVVYMSRQGKFFNTLEHLTPELKRVLAAGHVLDGELYNHALKNDFQKLISLIRRDKPIKESALIEYHVYDIISEDDYATRRHTLLSLLTNMKQVKTVETYEVSTPEEIKAYHDTFVQDGYEGAMVRNKVGPYEIDKRSYNLQKYKEFMDEEFKIIGAEENKGKQEGQCSLICVTQTGQSFSVKPKGSDYERCQIWEDFCDGTIVPGDMLTVRFFGYTNDGIPRFPIGTSIRNFE